MDYVLIFGENSKIDSISNKSEVVFVLFPAPSESFLISLIFNQTAEFYAATEGNTSVINTKNKEGAVGYVPPLITKLYPLTIIKLDDDNETPLRQKNGLCIPCKSGEKGELLGLIDNSDPTRKFDVPPPFLLFLFHIPFPNFPHSHLTGLHKQRSNQQKGFFYYSNSSCFFTSK